MMQAMILAAGLGTRLKPYTELRPKPLFPVVGKSLLSITLKRLRRAGFGPVVVNAHHLRDQFVSTLADDIKKDVILQQEEIILGTGGGLRRALPHFSQDPVLVTNGDIFHTIDLAKVYHTHQKSGAAVTLVLHHEPRFNKVAVDAGGSILGFGSEVDSPLPLLAFTGIHVIDPAILRKIPVDSFADIIDCYRELIHEGGDIRALIVDNHFWTDMGTPVDYLALHGDLLAGIIPGEKVEQAPFYIDEGATVGENPDFRDWVAVGNNAR
ncbi:MAG: nucleotidyltransferase family protein, partial [Desulfobulbaceae bacterium]|nr:nucleotidyltransferase family protein [Desulfobulbaceae bacterium]